MNILRKPMKYFSAIFFLLSYVCFITSKGSIEFLIHRVYTFWDCKWYRRSISQHNSLNKRSNSATTVMPLLSASLYLGQFISPIIVTPIAQTIFGKNDIFVPYKIGVIICIILIYQV